MATLLATPEQWLNGINPRAVPRTQRDATAFMTSVPKEKRETLTMQHKLKLKIHCKEALPEPHFDFLTHNESKKGLDLLKSLYSVRMKVKELRQELIACDMHSVFVVPSMMCDDPTFVYNKVPAAGGHSVDLFTAVEDVDLDLMKNWSKYVASAGEPYLVENLLWSASKIKVSLTDGLKEKLIEKTMGWPVVHQTGVVYFKLIMNFIQDSTLKSSRSLITKLQELSVQDYEG